MMSTIALFLLQLNGVDKAWSYTSAFKIRHSLSIVYSVTSNPKIAQKRELNRFVQAKPTEH